MLANGELQQVPASREQADLIELATRVIDEMSPF
jgi:hypothetical protein